MYLNQNYKQLTSNEHQWTCTWEKMYQTRVGTLSKTCFHLQLCIITEMPQGFIKCKHTHVKIKVHPFLTKYLWFFFYRWTTLLINLNRKKLKYFLNQPDNRTIPLYRRQQHHKIRCSFHNDFLDWSLEQQKHKMMQ